MINVTAPATDRLAALGSYVDQILPGWAVPGTAIAVVKGDDVVHRSVHGLRDIENSLPLTPDTRFPLASVTKSFTAMSVALLVDEGKLSWDEPVRTYLPEFVLHDEYATKNVTVRDMLSHRTGMPRHDLSAWRLDLPRSEYVKRLRHLKPSATLREKFQYNNLMYYMSALLVETVAGQKWEEFMQHRVFGPLNMDSSNLAPTPPKPGQPYAEGYRAERDENGVATGYVKMPTGAFPDLSPGAAGALHSTLADLTKWLSVHVNEGKSGSTQFVSPANLKQMHLPHTIIPGGGMKEALFGNAIFTYGLGWMIEPYRGYTLIQHGGNVEGHSLMIGFVPQERIGVIVLCNAAGTPVRDLLMYEALDRALGLPEQDWSARYHGIFDPIFAGQSASKQTTAAEKLEGAPPSRSLEQFAGQYECAGYPDFAVRATADGLQASLVGSMDFTSLTHLHYDVFEWYLADFDIRMKVRFLTNDNGEIDAVSVPIEPAIDNHIFKRKQLELSEDQIASVLGEYMPPIAGMKLTVTSATGKVYMTAEGGAPAEIKPYKVMDHVIGFTFSRIRLDFELSGGKASRLHYKADGLTLVAERI